ncbi:hypothetical protein CFOL_v3_15465 [Cephalotus follicularis]|uniref:Uncharacterized protein n=1 Tax=Cephalotus follicularis TaxID=3775 RepID=A0A1Q3BVI2_CEPFO|nr:hypothetical protein CFOL_v3_15465 [Cephalotus follicularis]
MTYIDHSCCYFHPKEVVVGVCALCLNERLIILAAKQGHHHSSTRGSHRVVHQGDATPKKPPINLPKIFAFGSLLSRLEFRHWKSDNFDHDASTSTQEAFADSFISIKFEDNGVASWEKGTVSKVSLDHCSMPWNHHTLTNTVIEHSKPRGPLRWRKRIGHLFQVIRLKRSNKGNVCHVVGSKVEGVKVGKGWIRTLTKRRTKE